MECVATCRPGLEGVLEEEIRELGGAAVEGGKRSVSFETDRVGLYRMNMALRTAIQVLVPLRTFNARDYKWLYFQSRRTNWHQYFSPEKTLRIDVNGQSPTLRNTQYVVHRIKDGIVDTFRKLADGVRPSVDKREPEIHVVAHLNGPKVTLCLDSSGIPLFKRGYRLEHGPAPLKEDLAAGILLLSGGIGEGGLLDPMCGSGTFLLEGWMLATRTPPNLNRSFACQHWLDYDEAAFEAERTALAGAVRPALPGGMVFHGMEKDPEAAALFRRIHEAHFPGAEIHLEEGTFEKAELARPGALMVTNPPYGVRLGQEEDLGQLYRDLGEAARRMVPGGRLALFTTNRKAARQVRLKAESTCTLFNGALEGVLYQYPVRPASPS
ncbi:MAG: THUMP domain-containing protein [Oceanipulchritudo sp.]